MSYNIKDNLLFLGDRQVRFIVTPNKSSGNIVPQYVIEHFTGASTMSSTESWFKSKEAEASAHLLIGMNGEVTQFVKFNQRAWHAGKSRWLSIDGLNSFSVGIEFVNVGRVTKKGDHYVSSIGETIQENRVVKLKHKNESTETYWQTYTEEQLKVGLEITRVLCEYYRMRDVLGHDDIAPGRKADPGPAFPMSRFKPETKSNFLRVTANVNFRVGPGVEYKAIEVIPSGTIVTKLMVAEDWTRVDLAGKLGWISTKYLVAI